MIFTQFQSWLERCLHTTHFTLHPLAGDVGFRRYFRIAGLPQSLIAVIAPPATENNAAFLAVGKAFSALGVCVPRVYAEDLTQGFLLLEDFGEVHLQQAAVPDNADQLYQSAMDSLAKIQRCQPPAAHFDREFMLQELLDFREWLLVRHLQSVLSPTTEKLLQQTFDLLINAAEAQPQCCIHRDYHSRNLMILPNSRIGVLDFQDAMLGPITYDLISLIRDSYIQWPATQVIVWAELFHANYLRQLIPSAAQFVEWMDLMGIQRHLKASFIFARKYHRDQCTDYLNYIFPALTYVNEISKKYSALRTFAEWFSAEVMPRALQPSRIYT